MRYLLLLFSADWNRKPHPSMLSSPGPACLLNVFQVEIWRSSKSAHNLAPTDPASWSRAWLQADYSTCASWVLSPRATAQAEAGAEASLGLLPVWMYMSSPVSLEPSWPGYTTQSHNGSPLNMTGSGSILGCPVFLGYKCLFRT